jgi:hypothetical protein
MIVRRRKTPRLVATLWAFAFFAVALLASGCSHGPELIEVVGNVLFNGSPPPGPGSVFLAPIEDKTGSGARPAMADFDRDGKFNLSAFPGKSGIKPGRYRVSIQIWKERPQGYLKPGINLVPKDYKLDELEVDRGQKRVEVTYSIVTNKS